LANPARQIFVESSAALSERQIYAVYTYPTADGTWGALFRLDTSGRKILAQLSSANRGRSFVVFVGNHKLARQLPEDVLIDEMVVDGMLPIPRGLSYAEVLLLLKHFKPLSPGAKPFPPTP
jgi:preprotein translocase subunit SecD